MATPVTMSDERGAAISRRESVASEGMASENAAGDHVLIWGAAYATRNLGDMAIAVTLATHLRRAFPAASLTFLTAGTKLQHLAALSNVTVLKPLRYPREVLSRLRSGKKLVIAGGVPFQDSLIELLKFLLLVYAAKSMGASVVVIAASAMRSDFRPLNRLLLRLILARTDRISVRDMESYRALTPLVRKPIGFIPDLALSLNGINGARASGIILPPKKRLIVVGLRNFPSEPAELRRQFGGIASFEPQTFCCNLAKALSAISDGATIVFLPMNIDEGDQRTAAVVASNITATDCAIINVKRFITIDAARDIIAKADLVIGMRLHTVIFALGLGRPTVALAYSVKVQGFMRWAFLDDNICELASSSEEMTKCFRNQLERAIPDNTEQRITTARYFLSSILDKPSTYASDKSGAKLSRTHRHRSCSLSR